MIAVIEPLEMVVRARFGHSLVIQEEARFMIAVMEPLEVSLRAQLRHMGRSQMLIAVIEPLEVVVRP